MICELCEGREGVILGDSNLLSIVWSDEGGIRGDEGMVDKMFMESFTGAV